MDATTMTVFSITSHYMTDPSINASFPLGSLGGVHPHQEGEEGIDPLEMPTGFPESPWPCNHTGPLVMKEKYPLPMLVESAWTLDTYEIIQIVAFVFVFVLSVCGNLVIMIVVYLNNFLRSTINYYLVNLAVSDLLITLLCWPTITTQLTQPFYILGRPLCKINVLTQTTCVTASVMTLSAVACDRVYAVMLPLKARSSSARPTIPIIIIWSTAIMLAIPAFLVRDVQVFQWDDLTEESCSDILPRCDPNAGIIFKYYRILLTVMLFFLPAVVMVVAYAVILLRLWCVKRPATSTSQAENARPNPHIRAKRKIVKMTAMVLLTFLFCWSPLHILLFYDLILNQALPPFFNGVVFWAYFLGYCNSALNPLLYGGFSDNFRQGFKNMCRPRRYISDNMHMHSTACGTSVTYNLMSSRRSLARRSSAFQHHFNPSQMPNTTIILNRCNEFPRRQSIQYSRRSSMVPSNPQSRRSSVVKGLAHHSDDSVNIVNSSCENSLLHLVQPIEPCESSLEMEVGKCCRKSECPGDDESNAALLNENLSKIQEFNETLVQSPCDNCQEPPPPTFMDGRKQSLRYDNLTSIQEEGQHTNDNDRNTFHDRCQMNDKC